MKKDEQTNVLLSLKNLYRLFTVKDYPVYSTGILGEKSKKGLTLVRFWDEYLLYEWKSTRHGKMIFRKDGSQNRYHSEFCNRKESFPLYHIYIEEVLEGLNTETFGSQVLIFEKFLKEKNYNHSVFVQKLRKFLGMVMESDPWLSQECGEKLIFWIGYIEKKQKDFSQSFGDAWLFTLLSLHAMAGPEISGAKMELVRNREDLKPEYIWSCIYQESGETRQSFLTLRNCELFRKSVKASHFFGREEELYDLKEMFFNSGKYLISGIGGIGKTEFAKIVSKKMYPNEDLIKINFGNYSTEGVLNSLIGAPLGYKGCEEGGELINKIKKSKSKVILIDEFEKATPSIYNFFYELLEDGVFTDRHGNRHDLNGYIIIFTSNMTQEIYQEHIPNSLRSRFDMVYYFENLQYDEKNYYIQKNAKKLINELEQNYGKKVNYKNIESELARLVVYENLRDIKRKIEDIVFDEFFSKYF